MGVRTVVAARAELARPIPTHREAIPSGAGRVAHRVGEGPGPAPLRRVAAVPRTARLGGHALALPAVASDRRPRGRSARTRLSPVKAATRAPVPFHRLGICKNAGGTFVEKRCTWLFSGFFVLFADQTYLFVG